MVSMPVSWAASKHANQITYQLQYRLYGSQVWLNATAAPIPATTAIIDGLTPGKLYEFRHIASNGPVWTEISVPTQLRAGTPPSAPANLKVRP